MAATEFDLTGIHALERGFPWTFAFTRKNPDRRTPVDLSGTTARLEIFDTQHPRKPPVVFSTASGHVTLGGAAGSFTCSLSAPDTALLNITAARYRVIFTDGQGADDLYLRGRLAVLEPCK
jgi:hypothetical protein